LILALACSFVGVLSQNPRPIGFLDVATNTTVAGWACDASNFTTPLRINIRIDGEFVISTIANLLREPAVGNECGGNRLHGFSITLPARATELLNNGLPHEVSAIALNIPSGPDTELTNSPIIVVGPNYLPRGFLDTASTEFVTGWACDANNFSAPLLIRFFIDNTTAAGSTIANLQREPAVGNECGGNPFHGFRFVFPQNIQNILNNGRQHFVSAIAVNIPTGPNVELEGSPKVVGAANTLPIGRLDLVTFDFVVGWACDPNNFNSALQVNIFLDNTTFIGSITANLLREPAVGNMCGGNRLHGFRFLIPQSVRNVLNNGLPHTISAIAVNIPPGPNVLLPGSPKTLQAPNFRPLGFLDVATVQEASGWACDPNNFDVPLQIRFFVDGNIAAGTTTANLLREPAVGNLCGGNRLHGFRITFPPRIRNILSNGLNHSVHAVAVNIPTGPNSELENSPLVVISPIGRSDTATSSLVQGWTCIGGDSSAIVMAEVYIDDTILAGTVQANMPREPEVGQQCGGFSNRGFAFNFPAWATNLLNQGGHFVTVYGVHPNMQSSVLLSGSPIGI
jgi:hypothetical protein